MYSHTSSADMSQTIRGLRVGARPLPPWEKVSMCFYLLRRRGVLVRGGGGSICVFITLSLTYGGLSFLGGGGLFELASLALVTYISTGYRRP